MGDILLLLIFMETLSKFFQVELSGFIANIPSVVAEAVRIRLE